MIKIPDVLYEKALSFPECSYGAQRVNLIMKDGSIIENVILAGGSEIVKVGGRKVSQEKELGFNIKDIVDVAEYNF